MSRTKTFLQQNPDISSLINTIRQNVRAQDRDLRLRLQNAVDAKTKPPGSLGMIERLAVQMGLIQNSLTPSANKKGLLIFASDHDITEEGVSAYPSEVTAQMVMNFLSGGAAINVFCRQHNIEIMVADVGVKSNCISAHPLLITDKVRSGTANFARGEAMTPEELVHALRAGILAVETIGKRTTGGLDIIGFGEMGIGNTAPATALICAASGMTPAKLTGRGTGLDDHGLKKKIAVLEKALALHTPQCGDAADMLIKVGGLDIAGITGGILAAASQRIAVVLDGVISTAAGLMAWTLCPETAAYMIAGHASVEHAQRTALQIMDMQPVLDLQMRLGEGTGAALASSIVDSACRMLCEMATFSSAGVSGKGK